MASTKKRWEIQVGGQEMAVMVGFDGTNFNSDNSGQFVLPPPSFTRTWHQIDLNYCY